MESPFGLIMRFRIGNSCMPIICKCNFSIDNLIGDRSDPVKNS